MKDTFKEWGIPILLFLVVIGVYIYKTNPEKAEKVTRSFEDKPYVSYRDNSIYIDEFKYTVGIVGHNEITGDWDKLNEKVYDLLKGKKGNCDVYLLTESTDQYGNQSKSYYLKGNFDIDELNKYQSEKYWRESGILQKIIINGVNSNANNYTKTTVNQSYSDTPYVESSNSQLNDNLAEPTATQQSTNITQSELTLTFNTSAVSSWQYYKVASKNLEPVLDENEKSKMVDFWAEHIKNIRTIEFRFYPKKVGVIINYNGEILTYILDKVDDETYSREDSPNIAVRRYRDNICEIYFFRDDKCLLLNNRK